MFLTSTVLYRHTTGSSLKPSTLFNQCSPQRTPDFLSSFLALANFMRLSLMKAVHAGVGGAPCRKSGYMGRKRILQMLSLHAQGLLLLAAVFFRPRSSSVGGCAPYTTTANLDSSGPRTFVLKVALAGVSSKACRSEASRARSPLHSCRSRMPTAARGMPCAPSSPKRLNDDPADFACIKEPANSLARFATQI